MALIGDFLSGAGAVGAQMSMEALRSTIEEERTARLAEMQNKFQVARDNADRGFRTSERVAGQDYQVGRDVAERGFRTGEREAGQAFQSGEAVKADTRLTDRMYVGASIAEEAETNRFEREQPNKDREFAQRDRQIGISGGHLALAREQAMKGAQVIGEDGRVAFVSTTRGADGSPVVKTTFLKTEDGKDFIAPKNISERQKMEFSAIGERIKALDKVAADAMNPDGAQRARAEILALTDKQAAILNGGKAVPAGPVVKDPFAKKDDKAGDAKFEEMKARGAKAGPMVGPNSAPKAAPVGDDAEPPKFKNRGQLSPEWQAWKERQDAKAGQARGAEIRAVRGLINP